MEFVRKEKVAVRLNLARNAPRFYCSEVCKSGCSEGHLAGRTVMNPSPESLMANAETEGGGVCWLLVRPTNKLLKKILLKGVWAMVGDFRVEYTLV